MQKKINKIPKTKQIKKTKKVTNTNIKKQVKYLNTYINTFMGGQFAILRDTH